MCRACVLVPLVVAVCVSGGSRSLLKLSQAGKSWRVGRCWTVWKDWALSWWEKNGAGGYPRQRISAALRLVQGGLPHGVAPILDNSYKRCYNKCNDNNKKAISHQTGKNAPLRRFPPQGYKSMISRQKRRKTHLHKIWEYRTA